MMQHTRLAYALAFLAACGDAGTSPTLELNVEGPADVGQNPDGGTPPEENEAVTVEGVYSVPVSDPTLEPFASQRVVLDWREDSGSYRLDYDFPTDLTGVSQRVELEGARAPDGSIQLAGAVGSASCEPSASGAGFTCTERFLDIRFDLVRLERDLQRRGLPAPEIERRLEVASLFQSDPIGVLTFALD